MKRLALCSLLAVVALSCEDAQILDPEMLALQFNLTPIPDPGPPVTGGEGSPVEFDGSGSTDPDGDPIVSYHWEFGDGQTAEGTTVMHVYEEDGEYTVRLTVTDTEGLKSVGETTATIFNVPPFVFAGPNLSVDVGAEVALAPATFDDQGVRDTHTATIDWGDGTVDAGVVDQAQRTVSGSHSYPERGEYLVTVTVTDDEGESGSGAFTVSVTGNLPPVADAGPDLMEDEGVPVHFDGSGSTDPDGDPITGYHWDFGDGTTGEGPLVSHVYADDGAYSVTLTVTDERGATGRDLAEITILNVSPTVDPVPYQELDVGEPLFVGTPFHDPGLLDTHTALIDWGDGSVEEGAVSEPPDGLVSGSHPYATAGLFSVTVTVTDDDGGVGSTEFQITVRGNSPPVADAGEDVMGDEGKVVVFDGSRSHDPDAGSGDEIVGYFWDFGDGTTGEGPLASHVYADDNTYVVTLTVEDEHGLTGRDVARATIANVAPSVYGLFDHTILEGEMVGLPPAMFHDRGTADTHTATIYWGDGMKDPGVVTESPYGPPGSEAGLEGAVDGVHVYPDAGVYPVRLVVEDDDGGHGEGVFMVTVMGNNPPIAVAGPDVVGDEGMPVEFDGGSSYDPDAGSGDAIVSYHWDFGDGSGADGLHVSHVFADEGDYPVTLTVFDTHGAAGSDVALAMIHNVPPFVSPVPDQAVRLGEPVSVSTTFGDPGLDDVHGATVDWGDGVYTDGEVDQVRHTVSAGYTYQAAGVYTAWLTVFDHDGGGSTVDFTVTVTGNTPPEANAGPNVEDSEGSPVTFDGSMSIDRDVGDAIVSYEWDFGDGTTGSGSVVMHVYADNGTYPVTLTVVDMHGASSSDEAQAVIRNVAPSVAAGPDLAIDEGDAVSLAPAGFHDQGTLDTHTATIDWGDGAAEEVGVVWESPTGPPGSSGGADGTVTGGHVYADDGTYLVTVEVRDDDGAVESDQFTVTVLNVAPELGSVRAPAEPQRTGTGVTVSADFTDAGILDTHTATVDWGDGNVLAATVDEADGSGSLSGTHSYATPGVYTLTVSVMDDDGDLAASVFEFVVIYDPEGGFVTGGGWIYSDAGAYHWDTSAEGKANFGFVSKYKKGASTPSGQTEFQFKAGDLNFHSSSYDWLVVAEGGTRAQYKGWGTINGGGDYRFMLWAGDGSPDSFRIRIWEEVESTGEESVVYDNGFDQAIGGGSIVIHSK